MVYCMKLMCCMTLSNSDRNSKLKVVLHFRNDFNIKMEKLVKFFFYEEHDCRVYWQC